MVVVVVLGARRVPNVLSTASSIMSRTTPPNYGMSCDDLAVTCIDDAGGPDWSPFQPRDFEPV